MKNLGSRVEIFLNRWDNEQATKRPGPYAWKDNPGKYDYPTALLDATGYPVALPHEETHGYSRSTLSFEIDNPFDALILAGLNEAPGLIRELRDEAARLLAVIEATPTRDAITIAIASAMTKGASQMSAQEVGKKTAEAIDRLYRLKTLERMVADDR